MTFRIEDWNLECGQPLELPDENKGPETKHFLIKKPGSVLGPPLETSTRPQSRPSWHSACQICCSLSNSGALFDCLPKRVIRDCEI